MLYLSPPKLLSFIFAVRNYSAFDYEDLAVIVGIGADAESFPETAGNPVLSVEAYRYLSPLARHHLI